MEKPKLLSASFVFTQESNCMSPDGIEEIAIDCLSDLMIEKGECFFVLKTESWSIDSQEELNDLLTKIKNGLTEIS
jgi:hypothetical protein